jgi:hypothetical protein
VLQEGGVGWDEDGSGEGGREDSACRYVVVISDIDAARSRSGRTSARSSREER